jgi:hypothetical protein
MNTTVTRAQLHAFVENIPEERIQEIYEILENAETYYSDEFKAELDAEYADYQLNGGGFTQEQVEDEVNTLLYGNKH